MPTSPTTLLAPWIRERVWRADEWCGELTLLRLELTAEPRTAATAERTFELARATEACDPDRGRALALYLDAWRAGHAGARERAKQLALDLRAYLTLAELALADGELVTAGVAFLDAGFPQLAVEPLQRFVDARPAGSNAASEDARLAGVRALLALAHRRPFDVEPEIADALARAGRATGGAAATAYLHAARLARAANLGDRVAAILATATRACPDDDAIAAAIETRLLDANGADELLALYRTRFERSASRAIYVERVRAAGVELVARNLQPGLGLRLLRMSLEHAYDEQVGEVRAHVASWELMWTHAKAQHSTLDLVSLLVRAMASPLSDDAAVYLARLGLEIAWRDAADTLAAQPYAAMLLDFVPDHPLATAFVREVVPDGELQLPPVIAPLTVRVTTPSTAIAPLERPTAAAPATGDTAATAPSAKTTSRIPAIDQGQIKRVAAPAPAQPRQISGRLALLTPPPPRATTLKRDTSPIPLSPRPAKPTSPRAPRKVVPVDAVIELPSGAFFSTVLRDVSTSGAFVVTKRALEIGTLVALELRIPVPGSMAQTSHRTNARIARRTDVGCGLAFVEPSAELVAAIRATTE